MDVDDVQYYHEISLAIPSLDVDAVTNYIIENICGGILLEDEENESHTTIKFYLADKVDTIPLLNGLQNYLIAVNPDYSQIPMHKKRIKNLDWINAYKESAVPVTVGDTIVVKPPWSAEACPGRIEIIVEPKMAFGTGRHESTRGSLIELEKIDLTGKTMLDLGCGSGILGIYAAKRGAREVLGYDIDPLAVENSIENFGINKVESVCRAEIGAIENVPDSSSFDVIVVNIIKSVIVPIIGALKSHLAPGGTMILAGLLDQDRKDVENALAVENLKSYSTRSDNEWITYTVRRS
jgi:ribosomal protein L11 methyltransferase